MKKFQDSSSYISHLRRLATIMNSSIRDDLYRSPQNFQSQRKLKHKSRQRFGQKQTKWQQHKQNLRIADSIINKPGVVNFRSTEVHFQQHLRIRKLRTMFTGKKYKHKSVTIKDVIWKNQPREKDEVLRITDGEGLDIAMSRDQLKEKVINLDFDESIQLRIAGQNKKGRILVKNINSIPIMHKGKGIGTAIINIEYY